MPTSALTRPTGTDTRHAHNLAGFAATLIVLFIAVFSAGYNEVNLFAGAAHTAVITWHAAISPWTYLVAAFVAGAVRILRAEHG